ncbi:hypothetical protein BDM02DRAFT_3182879 [Thelephora ganbajun]|uniref:Uncharacterized protein n=1 Tax=Thelephora ganbajun TaxID=370292 RepID=A0ACB6ZU85_THEGA|nr:hypothetical protein BDM02DRAFT_3182879 [Thelephora ganbajun]
MALPVSTDSDELGLQCRKQKSQSMPRGEINIESIRALEEQIREHEMAIIKLKSARNSLLDVSTLLPEVLGNIFRWNVTHKDDFESIRALEEQIREHEMAIIKLKRARNSLLNVSTLPSEVLGDVFRWNVTLKNDFDGLEKGSYNFLLVCHHWFEVASHTPELWSSWGNNLWDWKKRFSRYPTAPLDLVLNGRGLSGKILDNALRDALQDRAARDTIRRIHLLSGDSEFLASIISSLTINCEEIRSSSMESFILLHEKKVTPTDVSDFFAYHRFPKLRRLELINCTISSWDFVISRTSALTTLILHSHYFSPTPTTSQLLSMLASNPTLREISFFGYTDPDDGGGKSSIPVPLHHLRDLDLTGSVRDVFGLLHQLDYPRDMDSLVFNLDDCTLGDISQIVGPYLRDYLRRRGRSQSKLGLDVSSEGFIAFHVGDVGGIDFSAPAPGEMNKFVVIRIELNQMLPKDRVGEAILNLITHVPREEIVYFRAHGESIAMEDTLAHLPHLRALHLVGTSLSAAFPRPTLDNDGKIFPSLQHITLDKVIVGGADWSLLMIFLTRRASSGSKLDTLEITGSYVMHPRVEKSIKRMVRKFRAPES